MRNFTKLSSITLLLTAFSSNAQQAEVLPRAFYKGCLVTSITGGPGKALFTTFNNSGEKVHSDMADAQIDPLIMEYGLTDKIGIGLSRGGENYTIDANKFFNAGVADGNQMMWTSTKYLTADLSYHPYTTKRIDVSVVASTGFFKVMGNCYKFNEWSCSSQPLYSYTGKGVVARGGIRARYYFTKRFGLMALAYGFSGIAKAKHQPNSITDQKNNTGYYTSVSGGGLEFGLCFRIFKQKGVKEESSIERKARRDKEKAEKEETDKVPLFRLVWD